jgi:hypothetical protein
LALFLFQSKLIVRGEIELTKTTAEKASASSFVFEQIICFTTKTKEKCRIHSPYTLFSRQNPRSSFKMAAQNAATGLKDRDDIPLQF